MIWPKNADKEREAKQYPSMKKLDRGDGIGGCAAGRKQYPPMAELGSEAGMDTEQEIGETG